MEHVEQLCQQQAPRFSTAGATHVAHAVLRMQNDGNDSVLTTLWTVDVDSRFVPVCAGEAARGARQALSTAEEAPRLRALVEPMRPNHEQAGANRGKLKDEGDLLTAQAVHSLAEGPEHAAQSSWQQVPMLPPCVSGLQTQKMWQNERHSQQSSQCCNRKSRAREDANREEGLKPPHRSCKGATHVRQSLRVAPIVQLPHCAWQEEQPPAFGYVCARTNGHRNKTMRLRLASSPFGGNE